MQYKWQQNGVTVSAPHLLKNIHQSPNTTLNDLKIQIDSLFQEADFQLQP
jgi:hypothetical protein